MEGLDTKSFWQNIWDTNNRVRRTRLKIAQSGNSATSKKLGIMGIIFSLISLGLSWFVGWFTAKLWIWAFSGIYAYLLGNFMLIVSGIVIPFFFIQSIVAPCLLYPIHQLILNRKAIGWISLIIGIAGIITSIIGVGVFFLNYIGIINII